MKVPALPGVKLPEGAAPYLALGGVVIGGALLLYFLAKREVKAGADVIGRATNITSEQNVFYKGAQDVGRVLSGTGEGEPFSLGAWLYEKTHPGRIAAENAAIGVSSPGERPVAIERSLGGGNDLYL